MSIQVHTYGLFKEGFEENSLKVKENGNFRSKKEVTANGSFSTLDSSKKFQGLKQYKLCFVSLKNKKMDKNDLSCEQ